MRIVAILVLCLGVALAGAAMYMLREFYASQAMMAARPAGPETVRVLAAKQELKYGDRLDLAMAEERLRWVTWPKDAVPEGAFTTGEELLEDMLDYAQGRGLFHEQLSAGADPSFRMAVSVVTETAWHALFIRNLLIRDSGEDAPMAATILHLPGFEADPSRHGTRSKTVIALDMSKNVVLIAGTHYAGEIKKSVFSLLNFHAPLNGIFPMHCSANIGAADLNPRGLKLPPVPEELAEAGNPEALNAGRILQTEAFLEALDELFSAFLDERVSDAWESQQMVQIREWIKQRDSRGDSLLH